MSKLISWSSLTIEITRRCNLECAHCFRGDAQNVDISVDVIAALLDKTMKIENILFTGGEPFLNIEGMSDFLELLKGRDIPLYYLEIVTNGTIKDESVIKVISDYSDYIERSHKLHPTKLKKQINIKPVSISISKDDYHKTDSDAHFKWYNNHLSNFATITKQTSGVITCNVGNAKKLPHNTVFLPPINEVTPLAKIGYITKERDFPCIYSNLCYPETREAIVLCNIYLSVHGELYASEGEWVDGTSDDSICSIFAKNADEILLAIDSFNADKPFCQIKKYIRDEVLIEHFRANIHRMFKALGRQFLIALYVKSSPSDEIESVRDKINSRLQYFLNDDNTVTDQEISQHSKLERISNFVPLSDAVVLNEQLRQSSEFEKYSYIIDNYVNLPHNVKELIYMAIRSADNAKREYDCNNSESNYTNLQKTKQSLDDILKVYGITPITPKN